MEIRNELLNLMNYVKSADNDDKFIYLDMLLERFEIDIKEQLEDLEHKQKELKDNLELLDYVKKELNMK